jgi:hypothetical protein
VKNKYVKKLLIGPNYCDIIPKYRTKGREQVYGNKNQKVKSQYNCLLLCALNFLLDLQDLLLKTFPEN